MEIFKFFNQNWPLRIIGLALYLGIGYLVGTWAYSIFA